MTNEYEKAQKALLALKDIENAFDLKIGGEYHSFAEEIETIRSALQRADKGRGENRKRSPRHPEQAYR